MSLGRAGHGHPPRLPPPAGHAGVGVEDDGEGVAGTDNRSGQTWRSSTAAVATQLRRTVAVQLKAL